MRKINKRFKEVITMLYCLTERCPLDDHIKGEDMFPHSVVTELLFSIRFSCSASVLRDLIFNMIYNGYKPFSFPKNSKEYIQVKNIIKIIDHAQEKKNK